MFLRRPAKLYKITWIFVGLYLLLSKGEGDLNMQKMPGSISKFQAGKGSSFGSFLFYSMGMKIALSLCAFLVNRKKRYRILKKCLTEP